MLWPSIKKRTARRSTNRKCFDPNEGGSGTGSGTAGFGVSDSGIFGELAIELIVTTSVKFGAVLLEMQEAGAFRPLYQWS
jgi:hypothetical protein